MQMYYPFHETHQTPSKPQVAPLNPQTVDKIRIALQYIQRDLKVYRNVFRAIDSVLPNDTGKALIREWCSLTLAQVEDALDCLQQERDEPVSLETLWSLARQGGYDEMFAIKADIIVHERYITDAKIPLLGYNLVRSPIGTGKTELIHKLLEQWEKKYGKAPRVLVLSHRKALVQNLSKRLCFESYMSLTPPQMRQVDRLVCTPNSLYKLDDGQLESVLQPYDIVVIDEIEQFLNHLTSKTFRGGKALQAFTLITHFIQRADTVLALDAHAGETAYRFLATYHRDTRYILNTYVHARGTLYQANSEDQWLSHLLEQIQKSEKPVVVACDTKSKVKELEAFLRRSGIQRVMAIHSESAKTREVRHFINNINTELPNYQVLIYSPTISTGVDIQADVVQVFGCFRGRSVTPEEMHQLLGRARRASEFCVYITPSKPQQRITSADEIYRHHYSSLIKTAVLCDYSVNGERQINQTQQQYLEFYSYVQAARNRSCNDYYNRFLMLATHELQIKPLVSDKSGSLSKLMDIRQALAERERELLLSAKPIDQETYNLLEERGQVTEEHTAGFERWRIEDFYGLPITLPLAEEWERGGREILSQFIDLYQPRADMIALDREQDEQHYTWNNRIHRTLRWDTLQLLSLIFGDRLHTREIPQDELFAIVEGRFNEEMQKHLHTIRQLFDHRPPGKNVKPLNVLRCLLKRIGLSLELRSEGREKRNKAYRIDPAEFEKMQFYAEARATHKEIPLDLEKPIFK